MKQLALGISDFKDVIDGNFYYIDKSLFIEELHRTPGQVVLITRPRRFGKTLNLSMLQYFYELASQDTSYLFRDLEVWQDNKMREFQGTHPVISLTFKDCKTTDWEDMMELITYCISEEYSRHKDTLFTGLSEKDQRFYTSIVDGTATSLQWRISLHQLSKFLHNHYGKKVIVLLDEYDTPIQDAYSNGYYKKTVLFIRSLLGRLFKDNKYLHRGIITGITRTAKEGIFSGLNNLSIFTVLDQSFSDKFGFTQEEVDVLLHTFKISNNTTIKVWYNGYSFDKTIIYNPWSLISCVARNGKTETYCGNTSDMSIIENIILRSSRVVKEDFQRLLRGESFEVELDTGIIFPGIEKRSTAIWSLLLFAGYLTSIDGKLAIPNLEIQKLFERMVRHIFLDVTLQGDEVYIIIRAFEQGNDQMLAELLNTYLLNTMSVFDIPAKESEKMYHAFMLGLFVVLQDAYEVKSNRESGNGRYDIALIPKDMTKPGIIIEFKKKQPGQTLETASKKALEQIKLKEYGQELLQRGFNKIIGYGIAFEGKKVAIKHDTVTR